MSRRNQSRRRRNYGRRQHEIRERRMVPDAEPGARDRSSVELDHRHAGPLGEVEGGEAAAG